MRAMVFAALLLALVPGFAAGQDPPVAQDQQTFQPAPTVVYVPYFVPYVVFVPVVRTHADGHDRAAIATSAEDVYVLLFLKFRRNQPNGFDRRRHFGVSSDVSEKSHRHLFC